jgi:hypothetical protein
MWAAFLGIFRKDRSFHPVNRPQAAKSGGWRNKGGGNA